MTSIEDIRLARQKADTILIETARVEGSLRVIADIGGFTAADAAAKSALKRVCRSGTANDNDGWIA